METVRGLLGRGTLPVAVALLSLLLTLPALWAGFLFDDHPMRLMLLEHPDSLAGAGEVFSTINGDPATNREFMNLGLLPWWTAEDLRLAFLRPLTVATHRLDYALWPDSPALMHLHSLLWLGALVWLAATLYRRIMPTPVWIGGLAALLYAIDDAPAFPATWIANRNALLATTFGVLVLICHDRWRRDDWKPGAWLASVCLAGALFSAEFGVATLAYLFAYALFVDGRDGADERPPGASTAAWWRRLFSLAPYALPVAAWLLVYRLGGYGTQASGFYVDPLRQPGQYLWALVERAPVLLLGQWALPYADAYNALSGTDALILWLRAVGLVALLAIALTPLLRGSLTARFWVVGMLLSLLPIAATGPSNRLLLFVGLGAMGVLAQFLGGLADRAAWAPAARPHGAARAPAARPRRWITLGVAGLLVLIHLVAAPLMHPLSTLVPPLVAAPVRAAMLSIPDEPELAGQTLVILNAPDHLIFVTILWSMRLLEGLDMGSRVRPLATQPVALDISRTHERSLTIAFEGGLYRSMLGWLFRGSDRPMAIGHVVELEGMSVEITRITPEGTPAEAVFRFDRPLDDPSLRWLRWQDGVYVPFVPPAVGESVTFPASRNPLEAQPDELLENYREAVGRIEGANNGSSR